MLLFPLSLIAQLIACLRCLPELTTYQTYLPLYRKADSNMATGSHLRKYIKKKATFNLIHSLRLLNILHQALFVKPRYQAFTFNRIQHTVVLLTVDCKSHIKSAGSLVMLTNAIDSKMTQLMY